MKNLLFIFLLSFFTNPLLQGQVMHSPHNLELSFGMEGFSTFVPNNSSPLFSSVIFIDDFGQVSRKGDTRLRPVFTARYRKTQTSGNYFGFSATFGHSKWLQENKDVSIFDITGQPATISFFEENKEGTLGIAYVYSFLITKNSPDWQFFIGGEGSVYDNFAENNSLSLDFPGIVHRNIFGARISLVPELTYLFPNSRVTASLRAKLPLLHFEHKREDQRTPGFSSFFGFGSSTRSLFELAAIERSRIEIGIGYFLEAN